MRRRFWLAVAGLVALSPGLVAAQSLRYLDPRDVAEAQKDNAALVQEFGGAETGPPAAYVQSVGARIGRYSGIADPARALHFTTLDSAVENAFSVPGGYVYITRQLMVLAGDESEIAFALGHEVGHIAANHAHIREQYARSNPFGVFGQIVGAVFGESPIGNLVRARARLNTLSFSREQEYEADTLGLRYLIAAGYDPGGGSDLLAALTRQTALEARLQGRSNRQTPEWASTHPLSENRMQRALQEARATGRLGKGVRNRDVYLSQIQGLYVDDDPAQGIIDGPTFTHPDLRVQFSVPAGYLMQNGTYAVSISGSAGKAQFSGGTYGGTLDNYILRVFAELTRGEAQIAIPPPQHVVINGIPAAYTTVRVNTASGLVDASVVAYQWDATHKYHFVMVTPGGYGIGPFTPMINSLRKITPAEAAAIRPRVVDIVTVRPGDTVQGLAARMAYRNFQLERFLALNGLAASSRLAPGDKVKIVVFGKRRS